MSKAKKAAANAKANAKKAAYAAKREEKESKVIMYIVGALVAAGVVFAGISLMM